MIRTLLAALAVLSLLCCVAVLVVKWRSLHGHEVEFTLGRPGGTQTHFMTWRGSVMIESSEPRGDRIVGTTRPYEFRDFVAGTLMLPSLFVAVELRRLIRRRMRRGMPEPLPTLPPITARPGRGRRRGR